MLFTGDSGEQFGYRDGWGENGIFVYTGEGQKGDMGFQRGNRAIRDHSVEGKLLELFESIGSGGNYRYVGQFACASWDYRRGHDFDNGERQVIVFHLVPLQGKQSGEIPDRSNTSLADLRTIAYQAISKPTESSEAFAKQRVYERSADVKNYVLARSNGVCESCKSPAPFKRKDDRPYLEPHHTRRVSDGGPDHPRWVGAICPNCHSEIHFGMNGENKNRQLQDYLATIEKTGN